MKKLNAADRAIDEYCRILKERLGITITIHEAECPRHGPYRAARDREECPICYFDRLEASELYEIPSIDLTGRDMETLDAWMILMLSGKWPEDFPMAEPEGYRMPDRPDSAWHTWDVATSAINVAYCDIRDAGKSWRDRPPML